MTVSRFEEVLTEGCYYGVQATLVHSEHSPYQHIEVLHHPRLGHILRIDGALQCSEADEACYHEPLVHMVLAHAPTDARVLIVGGGDGGAAEEVLKWPRVRSLEQVELDATVIALSRRYLRSLHHGLMDAEQHIDARFALRVGDGLAHIHALQTQGTQRDAMLLDLTDPGGPSLPLWNADFFARCAQVLGTAGVLGVHVGAPWAQAQRCHDLLSALRRSFAQVTPFIAHVPVYGGPWLMAMAAGADAPPLHNAATLQHRLNDLQGAPLTVIDGRILRAMADVAHRF